MKVELTEDKTLKENELRIACYKEDEKARKIKRYAEKVDLTLQGKNESGTVFIHPDEIYYLESVEKRTYLYLKDQVLETNIKLYEAEGMLEGLTFFRASKTCIVNVRYVKAIHLQVNRNLLLTMRNEEKIVLSRRNVKEFKQFIGME